MFLEITFIIKMKSLQREAIDSQKNQLRNILQDILQIDNPNFHQSKRPPIEQIMELRQIQLFNILFYYSITIQSQNQKEAQISSIFHLYI
ncbi:unnamed protein product [Paramecium primaurelia]|uniref:Uncharacterized protein n=1 Tax=Paramecium primaurelia TaxID=5886 RepID=A0A8S1MM69_PARPR|nr:unnamed protein product [Paramecium primaurelia]